MGTVWLDRNYDSMIEAGGSYPDWRLGGVKVCQLICMQCTNLGFLATNFT